MVNGNNNNNNYIKVIFIWKRKKNGIVKLVFWKFCSGRITNQPYAHLRPRARGWPPLVYSLVSDAW